jgi:hypothetical protein
MARSSSGMCDSIKQGPRFAKELSTAQKSIRASALDIEFTACGESKLPLLYQSDKWASVL